ncbi:MAG: L-seryl-tRNA(Sec) selenium transferase, partial [bacterium]
MDAIDHNAIRQLPAVDTVLRTPAARAMLEEFGHEEASAAIRSIVAGQRDALLKGAAAGGPDCSPDAVAAAARQYLLARQQPVLRRVINA